MDSDAAPVLTLLQAYLATAPLPSDGRLPPERALAEALGTSRGELRKALASMEADGQVWRHVGKGTFLGARPLAAIDDIVALAEVADAEDVAQARLILEPQLAALAARHASQADLDEIREALRSSRRPGQTWREYEMHDARLHRSIARSAANPVLLFLFDHLAAVRRALTWARVRLRPEGPPSDHPSFAEHDAVVAALVARDPARARDAMSTHVSSVHDAIQNDGLEAGSVAGSTTPPPGRRSRRKDPA